MNQGMGCGGLSAGSGGLRRWGHGVIIRVEGFWGLGVFDCCCWLASGLSDLCELLFEAQL